MFREFRDTMSNGLREMNALVSWHLRGKMLCPPDLGGYATMEEIVQLDDTGVIELDSPVPYYHQLYRYIEKKITAKEWRPGQLFPSEEELCARLDVSRTVVRQAFAELRTNGMIVKRSGKRTTIGSPKYSGDLMQDLRGFYEDARNHGQVPTTRVLELKVVPAEGSIAEPLQIAEGDKVIMLNRLRSLDSQPCVIVVTYIPYKLCPALINEDLSDCSLYELLASKYGLSVSKGHRTIQAVRASREDAKLMGIKAGSPTLLLKSIGLLQDGTPLEYFVARHRGDRSIFSVRLAR